MSVVTKLAFFMQQNAAEAGKELSDLSRQQDQQIQRKKDLRALKDMVVKTMDAEAISDLDVAELEDKFEDFGISTTELDDLDSKLDRETGPDANPERSWYFLKDHDVNKTWGEEHLKELEEVKDRVDSAQEEVKDSDEQLQFKIQYHWGNYSNYFQTASSLIKREDDHNEKLIGNL